MRTPAGAGLRARRRFGALALALGAAVIGTALSGCASAPAPHADADSYGPLPSWLPTDAARSSSMLVADLQHPVVASEGDEVEVRLGRDSVRMTVVGPEVPGEGLPAQPVDTTCTWTVTVSRATAPVRLRAVDFDVLDHRGVVSRVAPVPGAAPVPAVLDPGRSTTFELRAAIPTGEGVLRWSGGTGGMLAGWDFVVETD